MQTEDGQIVEPYSVSAGLDYPGVGPIHAHLAKQQRARVLAITDDKALKAAFDLNPQRGNHSCVGVGSCLAALDKVEFSPSDIVVAYTIGTRR